jgi:hypothetical protein
LTFGVTKPSCSATSGVVIVSTRQMSLGGALAFGPTETVLRRLYIATIGVA